MAKRFKLRICRVIPSFQSCRSKDPSTFPNDPVPSFFRLTPVNHNLIPPDFQTPPKQPHRSSFKHHVSSALISVGGCGLRSKSGSRYDSGDDHTESQQFQWQKEDEWHIIAKVYDESSPRHKIYNSSASGESGDDVFALPVSVKKKRRSRKKRNVKKNRLSTSSADSGLFSEGEETETLVSSSRSFSTESSTDFNPQLETIREAAPGTRRQKKKVKKLCGGNMATKGMCRSSDSSADCETPARLSMFRKLIPCEVEGKVKESFAVVKKSEDPFEDFKRSMTEMIVEKQMFEERDLMQLLQCFLSLNSRHHHKVIVEAFSEIWDAIFGNNRSSVKYRN